MPAEILNRLESLVPNIEASLTKKSANPPSNPSPLDPLISELRAMKFLWNLPIIAFDYLQDDDEKTCPLCSRKYAPEFGVCARGESPCALPCGHIAGHHCLRARLSPYEGAATSCPFCPVDFPQMFADPVKPVRPPTGDSTREDDLDEQVSQLSEDAGVSTDEVRRYYLSIDEVLARARRAESDPRAPGTEVSEFVTAQRTGPVGEREFPKNRKNAAGPILARAAMRAVGLVAGRF